MAHTAAFTATVRALQTKLPDLDVYALIAVADEVLRCLDIPVTEDSRSPHEYSHERYVTDALSSFTVMRHVKDGKKIHAIKELRAVTNCGLKEAKDAVEDARVWGAHAPTLAY